MPYAWWTDNHRKLSNGHLIGDEMHTWFAQPIAAGRMAADQQRALQRRVRVAQGRDVASRTLTAFIAAADRGATRLRRRRATAAAVLSPVR
jgi:hypothetical protein